MADWKEKSYTYRCRFLKEYSEIYCELPKIPIHLKRGGKIFPAEAVIDSGCSRTHITVDIANFLGIDHLKLPQIETGGIGGTRNAWKATILLEVLDHGEPFEIEVVIVEELPNGIPTLLGNNDFFNRFDVRFQRNKQYFYVKRIR
jgi:hypothetical protein